MKPAFLFLDAAPAHDPLMERAESMGYAPISASSHEHSPLPPNIAAVYPCEPAAIIAAARIAETAGLPHPNPGVASLFLSRHAQRDAWRAAGLPADRAFVAESLQDAGRIAAALGAPLLIRPASAVAGRGARVLQYFEDLPLLFNQAQSVAPGGAVTLEQIVEGRHLRIEAIFTGGTPAFIAILDCIRADFPFYFNTALAFPAIVFEELARDIHLTAIRALQALGLRNGAASVDIVASTSGPILVDALLACGPRLALKHGIQAAFGFDYWTAVLAAYAGAEPIRIDRYQQAAAIRWLDARPGVVVDVQGLKTAAAMPGVTHAEIGIRPNDVLGHTTDPATRDRIGFIVAQGQDADEAFARADLAAAACCIDTRTTR